MKTEELAFTSITELAPLIQRKEVSPVEVTQVYLDRIERLNGQYLAYLTVLRDEALAAARAIEQEIVGGQYRGPLHGIPIALKDLFAVKGVRLTCGSKILADHRAESDATVVTRLNDAGTILLGKLNMHEFAWGGTSLNPHYGTPRNPWDLTRLPGGSSGGCAVATAAGLAMGTLGTDTGGSVRIPASLSGIVGLKPTYGRVSRFGVYPLSHSCDHVGPMVRTVADAAVLLRAIAGPDPKDPTTSRAAVPDYTLALREDIQGLRLGVPQEYFFEDVESAVRDGITAAVQHLSSLGAVVEEVSIPSMPHVIASSSAIIGAEAYEVHAQTLKTYSQHYGADVRSRLMLGACIQASQYLKAQRFRTLLRQEMLDILGRVDALITPTTLMAASRIDDITVDIGGKEVVVAAHIARATRPFNMTGLPAISVPCGFTPAGLPIGLQIIGRPFEETLLLRVAYAYERSTPWHERHPAGRA
ncbi:MAG: aspartyl/glutamyl-tRNA amidotransferase subunit A [Desulfurellaceae bacterium]|nr:aspartyl/glutamyl-tRNA amidotransferase subunit A [Desulfurellaceae bacterium]